jgi:hypothetical protein
MPSVNGVTGSLGRREKRPRTTIVISTWGGCLEVTFAPKRKGVRFLVFMDSLHEG